MKVREATDIIDLVAAATSGKDDVAPNKRAVWEGQLVELDADQAYQASMLGIRTWNFFPSWSDFMTIYSSLSRLSERDQERRDREELYGAAKPQPIPMWVRRWMCARYLYARFGKERDLRPFRDMIDQVDPTEELMPVDAWVDEAATLKEGDLWNVMALISGEEHGERSGPRRPRTGHA